MAFSPLFCHVECFQSEVVHLLVLLPVKFSSCLELQLEGGQRLPSVLLASGDVLSLRASLPLSSRAPCTAEPAVQPRRAALTTVPVPASSVRSLAWPHPLQRHSSHVRERPVTGSLCYGPFPRCLFKGMRLLEPSSFHSARSFGLKVSASWAGVGEGHRGLQPRP